MNELGFTVDTHLLRELGDLLVGRDSTAILELVKNGYDADATIVRIVAQNLSNPNDAVLTVEDNGIGMTANRFRSAFLRIAGRTKEAGERRSPKYLRTYTGQKGIGRLASQKLAKVLEVHSIPDASNNKTFEPGVNARIDWEEIDQQHTLHDLKDGLSVTEVPVPRGAVSGTVMEMRSLKRTWSSTEVARFVSEIQTAQPPTMLLESDSDSLSIVGESLISRPLVRSASERDPGFELQLDGDLASGDELWEQAAEDFQWCIEIDVGGGRTRYRISPTRAYARREPLARQYSFEAGADKDLRFQARFYMMPGASSRRGPLKGFVRSTSGIRVYMEGFRVLPYAEYGDDWLEIDREYRSGARYYTIELDDSLSDELEVDKQEGLNAVASNGYFGAVFLTDGGAPGLESLVNREGFVPGTTFKSIREIVQNGVRLSVRVRRSVFNQRQRVNATAPRLTIDNESEPDRQKKDPSEGFEFDASGRTPFEVLAKHGLSKEDSNKIEDAAAIAATLSGEKEVENYTPTGISTRMLAEGFNITRSQLHSVQSLQPELRVLAGVGLQLGAFVHDINGMLASATTIRDLLRGLLDDALDQKIRKTLQVTLRAADELAHTLARQSSYLTDVLTSDPRRRRSKVKVLDRVNSVLRFLAKPLAAKNVSVNVDIPEDLRTGPMFPAEATILLTNLLTNATKNAATDGNIWIDGFDFSETVVIVISNNGAVVDLNEAERWFLPFESTTTEVDDVLGQGLGLGLPIVRALADDYRGDVRFVEPSHGVGTAIRVTLPKKGKSR